MRLPPHPLSLAQVEALKAENQQLQQQTRKQEQLLKQTKQFLQGRVSMAPPANETAANGSSSSGSGGESGGGGAGSGGEKGNGNGNGLPNKPLVTADTS